MRVRAAGREAAKEEKGKEGKKGKEMSKGEDGTEQREAGI